MMNLRKSRADDSRAGTEACRSSPTTRDAPKRGRRARSGLSHYLVVAVIIAVGLAYLVLCCGDPDAAVDTPQQPGGGGGTRFGRYVAEMRRKVDDHCEKLQRNSTVMESTLATAWRVHSEPWLDGQKHPFDVMVHMNDGGARDRKGPVEPGTSEKPPKHLQRIIGQLAETAREYQKRGWGDMAMMDIGVNYGWVSLSIAAMGIDVYSFEPMQSNVNFIRTSLCLSPPDVRKRVTLFDFGLSDRTQECIIVSSDNNIGDGQVLCDEGKDGVGVGNVREVVKLRRLDDVVPLRNSTDSSLMRRIVAVKMDTEGHEPYLVAGGKEFFKGYRIPVIHSEFNNKEMSKVHANAPDMMNFFFDELGYSVLENRPHHIGRMGSGPLSREVALNVDNLMGFMT